MSERDWEKVRAKVISSDLKTKILEAIEFFEVTRQKKSNSYGMNISLKMESKKEPESKSQYRIAEDLGKKYASVVRALKALENYGVILGKSQDRKITYAWTYKGILLFPNLASENALADFYSTVFGDYDGFVDFLKQKLNANKREASQLVIYLCSLCTDFLEWVRDQIMLPLFRLDADGKVELPGLEKNTEYWRELAIAFLLSHLVAYPQLEIADEVLEDGKSPRSLKAGIQKLFRFGSKWFKEAELDWARKQKVVKESA